MDECLVQLSTCMQGIRYKIPSYRACSRHYFFGEGAGGGVVTFVTEFVRVLRTMRGN